MEETHAAVLRHEEAEQQDEAAVHEDELHLVGEDHRAQAAAVDVEHAQHRGGHDPRRRGSTEHRSEQRAQHEHVGGGRRVHEHRERAHEGGAPAVGALEQVGEGEQLALAGALRQEPREQRRAHVVGHAEHEPVRDPVAPRELADAEDAAVEARDQRRHERGQRDAAHGHEVVLGRGLRAQRADPDRSER